MSLLEITIFYFQNTMGTNISKSEFLLNGAFLSHNVSLNMFQKH
jgi:hypothetical protein